MKTHSRIPYSLQVQATDLAQRLQEEWLRKLWGIGGKEERAVSGVLKGLQPEVAEVLGKVQRAVTEEIFPDQIDLLNNLLKPLLGIKESINCLFNSTDKNQTRDMEREVEMLVSQIQVSTLLRGLNGLVRVAERLLFLQHEQEARAGVRQWQVDPGVQVVEGVQEGLG